VAVDSPDFDMTPRGKTDAARHRDKIKEALRRSLPDIIGEEAIITRREGKIVKVPVRGLKSYHFRHGSAGGSAGGFGSGGGKKGAVVGRTPKPGQGRPGQPGDEPGIDYLETEIDLEELVEMMFKDLGLPNLKQKEVMETVIPRGWTFDSIRTSGIMPRLDKKRTIKEAIRRTEVLISHLMEETRRSVEACRAALLEAGGDPVRARELLASGAVYGNFSSQDSVQQPFIESSDLRFRTLAEDVEYRSNAVLIAMMDVSGSMDNMKKYFARSFFFWLVSFLRTVYENVKIRFIAHTTEAKLVDEEEFFHKGESGGTYCHTAYELANDLIDREYSPERWNIYTFHFSDGEDWDAARTAAAAEKVLERGISAFGYGEIQTDYSTSVLMQALVEKLELKKDKAGQFAYYGGSFDLTPLVGVEIRSKDDLYPALRCFLHKEHVGP